jgi:hypothetical protein
MALDNERIVGQAYKIAEAMDMAGWVAAFTEDGTFTGESIGVTWKGPAELRQQAENYHRASRTCTPSCSGPTSAAMSWRAHDWHSQPPAEPTASWASQGAARTLRVNSLASRCPSLPMTCLGR